MNELKNFLVGILLMAMIPGTVSGEETISEADKPSLEVQARVLLGNLFSPNLKTRINAAVKLGEYEHPRVTEGLMVAVRRDSSDMVKRMALKNLGKFRARKAAAVIIDSINSGSTAVKIEAIKAGVKLSSVPVNKVIVKQIDSANPLVRQEAVSQAGEMATVFLKEHGLFGKIIKMTGDISTGVRVAACRVLGEHKVSEAVGELIDILKNDSSDMVRNEAADVLGEIGDAEAIEGLKEALIQSSPKVRISAALALAKLGSDAGLNEAINGIKSSDYEVRARACRIIGLVGDESMVFLLEEALSDFDRRVKNAACEAVNILKKEKEEKEAGKKE